MAPLSNKSETIDRIEGLLEPLVGLVSGSEMDYVRQAWRGITDTNWPNDPEEEVVFLAVSDARRSLAIGVSLAGIDDLAKHIFEKKDLPLPPGMEGNFLEGVQGTIRHISGEVLDRVREFREETNPNLSYEEHRDLDLLVTLCRVLHMVRKGVADPLTNRTLYFVHLVEHLDKTTGIVFCAVRLLRQEG